MKKIKWFVLSALALGALWWGVRHYQAKRQADNALPANTQLSQPPQGAAAEALARQQQLENALRSTDNALQRSSPFAADRTNANPHQDPTANVRNTLKTIEEINRINRLNRESRQQNPSAVPAKPK